MFVVLHSQVLSRILNIAYFIAESSLYIELGETEKNIEVFM